MVPSHQNKVLLLDLHLSLPHQVPQICHAILATLQDAWESPVESSVSSSPLRSKKVEKISLARGNGIGMHSMNNSGGREHKQFLKTKTMSENGYKQFVSTNDVEHFAVDCKRDG